MRQDGFCPSSLKHCFTCDESELNPTPRGVVRKVAMAYLNPRYSMTTLMRVSAYYHVKSQAGPGLLRKLYGLLASYLRRKNLIWNDFEHGVHPNIAPGIVLHHTGVCITSKTIIETEVHLYRNVTFGEKNGGAPHIKRGAKIASHSVVLGPVVVGERAIVAPGAVVISDVPDGKIAAGVPAKIIGDVTNDNYHF